MISQAIDAYRSGQFNSIRKCAAAFGVKHNTLSRHIRGSKSRRTAHIDQQLLSPDQEDSLVEWILHLEASGNAVNHVQFRAMVQLICQLTGGPSTLGVNWTHRFLQRHPEVRSKIGQKIDHLRVQGVTSESVQSFFTRLENAISNFNVKTVNIWNMDETGIALGVCTNQVVLGTSSTRRSYVQRPENREWVSIIEAISAGGRKLRNVVIFKAQNIQTAWFRPDNIPDAL
jgi:hypothetical protein